jgi:hypothetical protein
LPIAIIYARGLVQYNWWVLHSPAAPVVLRDTRAFAATTATVLLTIALTATAFLYVARMIAVFPLEHDVTIENSTGDDWLVYNRYAVSVLNDGLTMPVVPTAYTRPGGFGYAYFIAGVYAVAGIRSEAVYFVQGLLLVGGIVGMYAVFRSQFSASTALAFLVALAIFMYVDVYRALSFRLLSENLLFPLFPALLFFLIRGDATAKLWYFALGGVVCGLCFLSRPNLVVFGPVAAGVVLFFKSSRPFSWQSRAALTLLAACAAVASFLPLRNYVVTGRPSVASVTNTSDWSGSGLRRKTSVPLTELLVSRAGTLTRRAAYLAGIPQFIRPTFRIRPHWLVMWAAFFVYLSSLFRRTPQFWEVLVLALSVAYIVPIVLWGAIASYGGRMIAPGVPLILVLAAKGVERLSRDSATRL